MRYSVVSLYREWFSILSFSLTRNCLQLYHHQTWHWQSIQAWTLNPGYIVLMSSPNVTVAKPDSFLYAFSHLQKRVCMSVSPSVHPLVRPQVTRELKSCLSAVFDQNWDKGLKQESIRHKVRSRRIWVSTYIQTNQLIYSIKIMLYFILSI